jgi:hypothetical protein
MPDLGFRPGRKESQPAESKKIKSPATEKSLDILSIRDIIISFKVVLGAACGAFFILRPTKPVRINPKFRSTPTPVFTMCYESPNGHPEPAVLAG